MSLSQSTNDEFRQHISNNQVRLLAIKEVFLLHRSAVNSSKLGKSASSFTDLISRILKFINC